MVQFLDTHVLLWFRIQPDSLGPKTIEILSQRTNELAFSIISALEIAQLTFKNRITLPQTPDSWFEDSQSQNESSKALLRVSIAHL